MKITNAMVNPKANQLIAIINLQLFEDKLLKQDLKLNNLIFLIYFFTYI